MRDRDTRKLTQEELWEGIPPLNPNDIPGLVRLQYLPENPSDVAIEQLILAMINGSNQELNDICLEVGDNLRQTQRGAQYWADRASAEMADLAPEDFPVIDLEDRMEYDRILENEPLQKMNLASANKNLAAWEEAYYGDNYAYSKYTYAANRIELAAQGLQREEAVTEAENAFRQYHEARINLGITCFKVNPQFFMNTASSKMLQQRSLNTIDSAKITPKPASPR